jgi:hypothetical protein
MACSNARAKAKDDTARSDQTFEKSIVSRSSVFHARTYLEAFGFCHVNSLRATATIAPKLFSIIYNVLRCIEQDLYNPAFSLHSLFNHLLVFTWRCKCEQCIRVYDFRNYLSPSLKDDENSEHVLETGTLPANCKVWSSSSQQRISTRLAQHLSHSAEYYIFEHFLRSLCKLRKFHASYNASFKSCMLIMKFLLVTILLAVTPVYAMRGFLNPPKLHWGEHCRNDHDCKRGR